jgi:hypothetical protein
MALRFTITHSLLVISSLHIMGVDRQEEDIQQIPHEGTIDLNNLITLSSTSLR